MILHPGFHERRVRTLSVGLAGLVLGVAPVIGSADVTGSDPVVQPMHREAPDDPPAERPATPPRGVISVGRIVARGEFESVQVNVDDNGNNIPGDAANEPSIAVDPNNPNIMAIGWRQFDSVNSNFRQAGWGYSQDGGVSWTFPGVLQPGVFRSDPVLDFDSEGTFYYNSLTQNFLCDTYISTDGGATWGDPNPAYGGDKAWMVIDRTGGMGHGHLYLAWSTAAGCCGSRIFTRSTDGGFTYMDPIRITNSPVWGTVTVSPDGALFVSGGASSQGAPVTRSSNAQDPDEAPVWDLAVRVNMGGTTEAFRGVNPGGLLGQMWIAADHSNGINAGNLYLLGSVNPPGGDPLDIMFSRSSDGGQTWSDPVRVNDDPGNIAWQWFGTMAVAPNGRIDAIWNDTRNDPGATFSELHYSFSEDGGVTWSENVAVSQPFNHFLGYPQQNKLGDYYDMISHNDAAHVAYAATFNGEQDVYYLRIEHATTVLPGSLEIVRGRHVGGDVPDIFASDDSRMVFQPGVTENPDEPPIWLILEGLSPTDAPAELSFVLETRVDTPGVTQRIELFNFDTGEYEEVDSRTTSFNADGVAEVTVGGDPSRFVNSESLIVQAQLTWMPPPLVILFPWSMGIDQAVWRIAQ